MTATGAAEAGPGQQQQQQQHIHIHCNLSSPGPHHFHLHHHHYLSAHVSPTTPPLGLSASTDSETRQLQYDAASLSTSRTDQTAPDNLSIMTAPTSGDSSNTPSSVRQGISSQQRGPTGPKQAEAKKSKPTRASDSNGPEIILGSTLAHSPLESTSPMRLRRSRNRPRKVTKAHPLPITATRRYGKQIGTRWSRKEETILARNVREYDKSPRGARKYWAQQTAIDIGQRLGKRRTADGCRKRWKKMEQYRLEALARGEAESDRGNSVAGDSGSESYDGSDSDSSLSSSPSVALRCVL